MGPRSFRIPGLLPHETSTATLHRLWERGGWLCKGADSGQRLHWPLLVRLGMDHRGERVTSYKAGECVPIAGHNGSHADNDVIHRRSGIDPKLLLGPVAPPKGGCPEGCLFSALAEEVTLGRVLRVG
jgi:hypothetical protein